MGGLDRTRPKISVIIPTFGRQLFLARAVVSALQELGPEDEILVVDDGSVPPITLGKELAADKRLRLVRSDKNRGAAAARNLGIANARHKLLAFLDSDDSWLPGKLGAQIALLEETTMSELVAVSCGWVDTRGDLPVRTRVPRPSLRRSDFFSGNWFAPGATLLVAKAAFDVCGPFREDLPRLEDYEWFIRFALAGGRVTVANIVGAAVAVGANARPGPVNAAAAAIWRAYRGDERLHYAERRRMEAFLSLVRAAGAWNAGQWLAFGLHLVRSFLELPRVSVQLEDWWSESNIAIDPKAAP